MSVILVSYKLQKLHNESGDTDQIDDPVEQRDTAQDQPVGDSVFVQETHTLHVQCSVMYWLAMLEVALFLFLSFHTPN